MLTTVRSFHVHTCLILIKYVTFFTILSYILVYIYIYIYIVFKNEIIVRIFNNILHVDI
jgi:hypothetical protein